MRLAVSCIPSHTRRSPCRPPFADGMPTNEKTAGQATVSVPDGAPGGATSLAGPGVAVTTIVSPFIVTITVSTTLSPGICFSTMTVSTIVVAASPPQATMASVAPAINAESNHLNFNLLISNLILSLPCASSRCVNASLFRSSKYLVPSDLSKNSLPLRCSPNRNCPIASMRINGILRDFITCAGQQQKWYGFQA